MENTRVYFVALNFVVITIIGYDNFSSYEKPNSQTNLKTLRCSNNVAGIYFPRARFLILLV